MKNAREHKKKTVETLDANRIQFRDFRKDYASTVASRSEVQYFRVEKKEFWHGRKFQGRVICVQKDGGQKPLSTFVVSHRSKKEFFEAATDECGEDYVQTGS